MPTSSTAWDLNTTSNWNNGSASTFYHGDAVTFNDSTGLKYGQHFNQRLSVFGDRSQPLPRIP